MRAIISGFEPIWGIKKTPSGELAKLWSDGSLSVDGVEARGFVLPQVYGKCTDVLWGEILSFRPHVVLMFGATQHNDPLRLERFAVNVERSPMGDNTRIPVKERPVLRGGPAAYEPTLPVDWLVPHLKEAGVDSKPSYHAGTHTCNSIFYGIMHRLAQGEVGHPVAAGFVHVAFPNEYGVIEDELWSTSSFSGIVKAATVLLEKTRDWYLQQWGEQP